MQGGTSTHREFEPGERCEVDYAGKKVEWVDRRTGAVNEAVIFVGVLGSSQYIFGNASANAKSKYFLEAHVDMYEYFGGVPKVTVPDCLKQGVLKCHLYDPDLNPSYVELAKHYDTAIVPARPKHPKDKAIVEGAVKLVMRFFKWRYRNHTFFSVTEIDQALKKVIEEINQKPHTRFKVSRYQRWQELEKDKLKSLPLLAYEVVEWLEPKVHPDCHISVDSTYYSVPHIYRGRFVKVRLSRNQVDIFIDGVRIALHCRWKSKDGKFITDTNHLPPNSRAYCEATPTNILSQARFINKELHELIKGMFESDTIGNIRRAQGLVREARSEINKHGQKDSEAIISSACDSMQKFNKIRVPFFKELLNKFRKEKFKAEDRDIVRNHANPMLRYNNNFNEGGSENGNGTSKKSNGGNETGGNACGS